MNTARPALAALTALAALGAPLLTACSSDAEGAVPAATSAPTATATPSSPTPSTGAPGVPDAPTVAPKDVGWVSGVVVDAAGRPLPGRLVNVLDAAAVPEVGLLPDRTPRRAYTDARGRFRVRQAPGGYLVQVCHPEADRPTCKETVRGVDHLITYVGGSGTTDSWVTQDALLPATEADRRLGEVAVLAKARVHGRVLGAEGQSVRIMRLNDTVAFTVGADGRGRYDIDGMAPGSYYLAAGGAGTLEWRSETFELVAGTPLVVDGRLERGVELTGRVRLAGRPAPGVELEVLRDGERFASTVTDTAGRYVLSGLTPATYRVAPQVGVGVDPTASRTVVVDDGAGSGDTVRADLAVRRGASVTVDVAGHDPDSYLVDELRGPDGTTLLVGGHDGAGRVTYRGLAPGRYTVVVGGERGYAERSVTVRAGQGASLGSLTPSRPYLTLTGRTSPGAVVEATTGDLCPAGEDERYGAVHEIEVADARGRYRIGGLLPGTYMLGSDHWPRTDAPRCVSGVRITADRTHDLPLEAGAAVTGRLVHAGTGTPVIARLSYELTFAPGSPRNPTSEHPARAKAEVSTGRFRIDAIRAGATTGGLAAEGGDQVIDESFFVVHPVQDGTPYWLSTEPLDLTLVAGETLDLGDVEVVLHGA